MADPVLRPCPFCDSSAVFTPLQTGNATYDWTRGRAECVLCGVRTPTLSKAEAVKLWNRRALPKAMKTRPIYLNEGEVWLLWSALDRCEDSMRRGRSARMRRGIDPDGIAFADRMIAEGRDLKRRLERRVRGTGKC